MHTKVKKTTNSPAVLHIKNKVRRTVPLGFKTYHRATVTNVAWCWHRNPGIYLKKDGITVSKKFTCFSLLKCYLTTAQI